MMTLVSGSHVFRSTFVVVTLLTTAGFRSLSADDSNSTLKLELPTSWAEFVETTIELGSWDSSGTTGAVWEGIPAGIEFTSTGHSKMDGTKTRIVRNYTMQSADGKIISSGGGHVHWDADSEKVRGTTAGYDFGKPYHGESEYLGFDVESGTEHWKHTETSRGKTTEYLITISRVGPNVVKRTVAPVDGSEPWVMESTRSNPLASALDGFDYLGTWVLESEDGEMRRDRVETILDGRAVSITNERKNEEGEWAQHSHAVLTWDPTRKTLIFRGVNLTGFTYEAVVESISIDGSKATMVTRGEGTSADGTTFMARLTRVIEGDTMTFQFHDRRNSNLEDDPDWVSDKVTYQRSK